jgi:hypothetical protein
VECYSLLSFIGQQYFPNCGRLSLPGYSHDRVFLGK